MLVQLLVLLNIIIINLNLIIITVFFNTFAEIWTWVRLGKFLQSHDSTIELATTDMWLSLHFATKKQVKRARSYTYFHTVHIKKIESRRNDLGHPKS